VEGNPAARAERASPGCRSTREVAEKMIILALPSGKVAAPGRHAPGRSVPPAS
jgi:hypothetical protein